MQFKTIALIISVAGLATTAAVAQTKPKVDPAKADAAMKTAFPKAPADWHPRLVGDETMKDCSAHRNTPPQALAKTIRERAKATIQYPPDGKLMGDWKKGEALAQSGYGMRFTDYPPKRVNGGNCYACHQLTKQEVSYGTMGPSLLEYGKIRKFSEADTKIAYDKIYNSHATFPCSLMPRFGANNFLTIDQIKDLTALLMSPDSPVNK
ncbi:MAG: sulfur oxidation c-type cytochrome SoxX [Hyphomicrobiaceae bacterium]|nr:MAG: sulfur oxidation c-type cytochrome SoxX [Hyphomicrobiaceae bacterium]